MKRLHAIVYGLVQGIYFRRNARELALKLGLTGTVENLRDGSVEVIAEGEENKLKELLAWLHKGPVGARVDKVSSEFLTAIGVYKSFELVLSKEVFW
jgi:acylphosphatase